MNTLFIIQAVLLLHTAVKAFAAVQITRGPSDTTAVVGSTVTFTCDYQGTSQLPQWSINGVDYQVTALPYGYWYNIQGLHIDEVSLEMNNTSISCFLVTYQFVRVQSETAILTVTRSAHVLSSSVVITNEDQTSANRNHPTVVSTALNVSSSDYISATEFDIPYTTGTTAIVNTTDITPVSTTSTSVTTNNTTRSSCCSFYLLNTTSLLPAYPVEVFPSWTPTGILYIGLGVGIIIILTILVTGGLLGLLIHHRCAKKTSLKAPVDVIYDTIAEVSGSQDINEAADITVQQNSAHVIPPPRLKLKVQKNDAYGSVAVMHGRHRSTCNDVPTEADIVLTEDRC